MRCTVGPSFARFFCPCPAGIVGGGTSSSSFVADVDAAPAPAADVDATADWLADDEEGLAAAADAAEEAVFFDWRADVKIPSGTTRSRSHDILSMVFRFPSVLFVKYASAATPPHRQHTVVSTPRRMRTRARKGGRGAH